MRIPLRAAIDSLYLASRSAFRLTCALSVAAVTWLVSQLAFAQSDAFTVPPNPLTAYPTYREFGQAIRSRPSSATRGLATRSCFRENRQWN